MKPTIIILLIVCIVAMNASMPAKKQHKHKETPAEIDAKVVFKAGAYNPDQRQYHTKDPYYRFRFQRVNQAPPPQHPTNKLDQEQAANKIAEANPKPVQADPQYTTTQDSIPEMKIKLTDYTNLRTEAFENQSKVWADYNTYRNSMKGLKDIKNNNDLATSVIDRGLENQLNIIQKISHVTIQLLNLDAKLELFNYQNFKFLVATTPEIESLKVVYNKLNTEVQQKRNQMVEFRSVMDQDYTQLMNVKKEIVSRDKYRNYEVQQAFEKALETFDRESANQNEKLNRYSIPAVGATAEVAAKENQEKLKEALDAVEFLEHEITVNNNQEQQQYQQVNSYAPLDKQAQSKYSRRHRNRKYASYDDEDESPFRRSNYKKHLRHKN